MIDQSKIPKGLWPDPPKAKASLVVAVLSIATAIIPGVGLILAIVSISLARSAGRICRSSGGEYRSSLVTAGFFLGVCAAVLSVAFTATFLFLLLSGSLPSFLKPVS